MKYIIWFNDITVGNASLVGGKNASLGHMIRGLKGKVRIPEGFALSVDAYWHFLKANHLDVKIEALLKTTDAHDTSSLAKHAKQIQELIVSGSWPDDLKQEILESYQKLCAIYQHNDLPVAVRSSATAEDLPTASFAGQQETYLWVMGPEALLDAAKKCMASLFTERAIFYRQEQGFDHMQVGLSVGVQKMIEADDGAAGVAFSLDTETGFKDVVMINGSWGLGEAVVKGLVTPDEFMLFKPTYQKGFRSIIKKQLGDKKIKLIYGTKKKEVVEVETTDQEHTSFCLSDDELIELTRYVLEIESFYSQKAGHWVPQDIEWAKDGKDNLLYIVQARPETVHSAEKNKASLQQYQLQDDAALTVLTKGLSVGQQIASGRAVVINDASEIGKVHDGDVIITSMTDPDWVPALKKASGIITDRGGRTCHAAIVSRELGIAAIVGTGNATEIIKNKQEITLDCSQGQTGFVYAGLVPFVKNTIDLQTLPKAPVKLLVNCADPDRAFSIARLPVQGVGLARIEFILSNQIGIHPMAIAELERCSTETIAQIKKRAAGYNDLQTFFVDTLAQSIGMIAAAFYPHEVIVRLSDLKTNEYRRLIGGELFEPEEENPMLGWRGASRYCHAAYQKAFEFECAAFARARNQMGFDNVRIMIPFVRTIGEAQAVIDLMDQHGLKRGKNGLQLVMMVELPANVLLIDKFAELFDGFSIGSNDLTQLVLGVDRDAAHLAELFDERNQAVKMMIEMAIQGAHKHKKYIGICGQAPSDYPEIATFLIKQGIDSISLNPDAVMPFLMSYSK